MTHVDLQKGGTVKNLCIQKYGYSASFCTKNQVKSQKLGSDAQLVHKVGGENFRPGFCMKIDPGFSNFGPECRKFFAFKDDPSPVIDNAPKPIPENCASIRFENEFSPKLLSFAFAPPKFKLASTTTESASIKKPVLYP